MNCLAVCAPEQLVTAHAAERALPQPPIDDAEWQLQPDGGIGERQDEVAGGAVVAIDDPAVRVLRQHFEDACPKLLARKVVPVGPRMVDGIEFNKWHAKTFGERAAKRRLPRARIPVNHYAPHSSTTWARLTAKSARDAKIFVGLVAIREVVTRGDE